MSTPKSFLQVAAAARLATAQNKVDKAKEPGKVSKGGKLKAGAATSRGKGRGRGRGRGGASASGEDGGHAGKDVAEDPGMKNGAQEPGKENVAQDPGKENMAQDAGKESVAQDAGKGSVAQDAGSQDEALTQQKTEFARQAPNGF